MSNHVDNARQHKKSDHSLKSLPTEVLLKARSTLVSLGGALKPRHDPQRPSSTKETKDKNKHQRLKTSRSEPEFNEMRKNKRRSRIEENPREYDMGPRPRPLSVGAGKRYEMENDFHCGYTNNLSPLQKRKFDSSEEVCVQSRLVIPVNDRINGQEGHTSEGSERPRKKLSFREPEIVSSGTTTLGRSHKLMGVNSLQRRPNMFSPRPDAHSKVEIMDTDLESQAMRIVRTVGQAFEVCHKMQTNNHEQGAASTSSAADEPAPSERASEPLTKEGASECGASEGAASTSRGVTEEGAVGGKGSMEDQPRPITLELLPPPPRKDNRRSPQRVTPSINLPELPECVTKVEVTSEDGEVATPLTAQHQLKLLRERLEQQAQQTRAAVAQLLLLRDQLAAEQAARCEAQARTHQLLVHNKELLEHIAALVSHLQERERGSSRPISAQQLTLLPQTKASDVMKTENFAVFNGNCQQLNADALINLIAQSNKANQNVENNNVFSSFLPTVSTAASTTSAPSFGGMTNEQIQNYLISRFENMGGFPNGNTEPKPNTNNNQQFFQNCNAFPNIPPLKNHYSNNDLASLLKPKSYKEGCNSADELGRSDVAQVMSVGQSDNSLYSTSQASSSKDSSPCSSEEGVPFIMPLSHNGTLTATGEDGRVRLIVPVSPSGSSADVPTVQPEAPATSGSTLKVPSERHLAPAAPITRTTSEKVPNRSEMMTALRAQWTRHTTK